MIGLCMRMIEPENRTDVVDTDFWFVPMEIDVTPEAEPR